MRQCRSEGSLQLKFVESCCVCWESGYGVVRALNVEMDEEESRERATGNSFIRPWESLEMVLQIGPMCRFLTRGKPMASKVVLDVAEYQVYHWKTCCFRYGRCAKGAHRKVWLRGNKFTYRTHKIKRTRRPSSSPTSFRKTSWQQIW